MRQAEAQALDVDEGIEVSGAGERAAGAAIPEDAGMEQTVLVMG